MPPRLIPHLHEIPFQTLRESTPRRPSSSAVVALLSALLAVVAIAALLCLFRLLHRYRRRRHRRNRLQSDLADAAAVARALRHAEAIASITTDPFDSNSVSRLAHADHLFSHASGASLDDVREKCPLFRVGCEKVGEEGDGVCAVCLEKLELAQRARRLPCKHVFHDPCAVIWLVKANRCPVCRCEVVVEGGRRETGSFRLLSSAAVRVQEGFR